MRVESGGQTHIHCRSSGQSKEFVWSFFFFFFSATRSCGEFKEKWGARSDLPDTEHLQEG